MSVADDDVDLGALGVYSANGFGSAAVAHHVSPSCKAGGGWLWARMTRAYKKGWVTPCTWPSRCSTRRGPRRLTPPLRAITQQHEDEVLLAAEESTQRYRSGAARGPLDGVPVAIKEQNDVKGYATTLGIWHYSDSVAAADGIPVHRLRAAGAVLIGTQTCEMGVGTTGHNPLLHGHV